MCARTQEATVIIVSQHYIVHRRRSTAIRVHLHPPSTRSLAARLLNALASSPERIPRSGKRLTDKAVSSSLGAVLVTSELRELIIHFSLFAGSGVEPWMLIH